MTDAALAAEPKLCPCGHVQTPVHSFADNPKGVLLGWYCATCYTWNPAIGREKKLHLPEKR